jgi:CRP-like cAMP-binding protein
MLTIIEKVLLLETVEVFSEVTTEQLSYLAAIARERQADPGCVIYRKDDPAEGLYIVVSGSVRMLRDGEEIDRVGPNGAFGTWALFDTEPRLASAETAEESRLLFVPRDEFYDVLSDNVGMVENIFKHLVSRVRRLAAVVGN